MDDLKTPSQPDPQTPQVAKGRRKPSRLNPDGTPRFLAGGGPKLIQSAQRILRDERPIIEVADSTFQVPAETPGVGYYTIILDEGTGDWCQCPDFRNRHEVGGNGARCKHIVAAELWYKHQLSGAALTDIAIASRNVTHLNPAGYNQAKARTIRTVEQLIRCLACKVEIPRPNRFGRKPKPMSAVVAQLLLLAAGRGAGSRVAIRDERDLFDQGIINAPMSFATRLRYMGEQGVARIMHEMLAKTTEHLQVTEASVDATYFKTPFSRELKEQVVKHEDGRSVTVKLKIPNAKLHIFVDNETQLILAARVTHGYNHEKNEFLGLFEEVHSRFPLLASIYADAGYYAHDFYQLVGNRSVQPCIDMPFDAKENGEIHHDRQLRMRLERQKAGTDRVNPRSNVESVNSQLKTMTYRIIRSQLAPQREVELLSMCIVYNLMRAVLLHGTRPGFRIPFADDEAEQSLARAAF